VAAKKPTELSTDGKLIRLKWDSGEDLPALYANQMLVTHGESEFNLVFGLVTPPVALSVEALPDEIHVKSVAKIVVTAQVMRKIIEALTKNIEHFGSTEKEDKNAS
jgi:hypothetical protein